MEWQAANAKLDRLRRFCIAFQYVEAKRWATCLKWVPLVFLEFLGEYSIHWDSVSADAIRKSFPVQREQFLHSCCPAQRAAA